MKKKQNRSLETLITTNLSYVLRKNENDRKKQKAMYFFFEKTKSYQQMLRKL